MKIGRTFFYKLRTGTLLFCMLAVTVTAALRMHPIAGVLSVGGALLSYFAYGKAKELCAILRFCAPLTGVLLLFNLLFNRNGVTVLFYLVDAAVTLESLLYAACSALSLTGTVLWFSFYCMFLDCDRVYTFLARFSRGLGMVVSLSLSLIPKTLEKYSQMRLENPVNTDKAHRFTGLILRLSALISWVFDDAFQTALSMKARGALSTCKRKTAHERVTAADIFCVVFASAAVLAMFSSPLKVTVYPRFAGAQYWNCASWYLPLLLVYLLPCMFKGWEALRWTYILRKI